MNHIAAIILMAVLTYLIRFLPLAFINEQIKSPFIRSFLHYIPYGILTAMTIPYIFYATTHFASAIAGTIVALILAMFEKSLIAVSIIAVLTAYAVEMII